MEGRKEGGLWDGLTCLMIAACIGHLNICRSLIDKGAQVEAKDSTGRTPLLWAAIEGHNEIVRLLCDHGAYIEAQDDGEWRSLHYAAYNGHISVVKELIEEWNAKINARTEGGDTALWWARRYNNFVVAAYLVSLGGIV